MGHQVSAEEVRPNDEKTKLVMQWLEFTTVQAKINNNILFDLKICFKSFVDL